MTPNASPTWRRWSAAALAEALGLPVPTDEQTAVIEGPLKSTLVVAGAGSGKTETMAGRVLWLVANGLIRPEQILGLTFTRKASLELSGRLSDRLQLLREHEAAPRWAPDSDPMLPPTVSTYHAYAGRLVGEHGLRIGVEPDARLLSEAAAWQVAHEVVHRHTGTMEGLDQAASTVVHAVLHLAGELAEHLVPPDSMLDWLTSTADRVEALPGRDGARPSAEARNTATVLRTKALLLPLVQDYQQAKRDLSALDFADQMALAARLARDLPSVADTERSRYSLVLLDEFQDTSEAQMVLLSSLFADSGVPVTAVGDPHQSIYGWRGASATTLSRFPVVFGDDGGRSPVLPLSTSWRNSRRVLEAANAVAAPLRSHAVIDVPRLECPSGTPTGAVHAARLPTHLDEAEHVAGWVAARFHDSRHQWTGTSAAVLCRNRAQFDAIVAALRRHGLPVEVVGLGGLLDAPELVDLVALLWAVQEPGRGDHLMRLLTGPATRLGAADLTVLWSWARHLVRKHDDEEPTLGEAVDHPPPAGWVSSDGAMLSEEGLRRVRVLSRAVAGVRAAIGLPLPDLLVEAEQTLGLDIEVLSDPDLVDGLGQGWARAHLDALIEVSATFAATADRPTLGGFLDWLEAARDHERGLEDVEIPELAEVSVSSGAVQVLTVHAAKGLEWDVVAVPGLAEGTFPVLRGSAGLGPQGWSYASHQVKGWLSGIGALPYPLRGDAPGLPTLAWESVRSSHDLKDALTDLYEAGVVHRVEEERRLAYVALTRARRELLLTAPVWSTGKRPRVTSRFLQEVVPDCSVHTWAQMPDDESADNPMLAHDTTAPWPVLPGARRAAVAETVQAVLEGRALSRAQPDDLAELRDPRAEQINVLLAERDAQRRDPQRSDLPQHLSASAVLDLARDPSGFRRRLRRPLPQPPAPHARVGTQFHAWVEHYFSAASLVDLDDLPGSADEGVSTPLAGLQESFLASEWAGQTPLHVELGIETMIAGRVVRGRIDAVFPRPEGGVRLVDWKTGTPGNAGERRVKALQLAVYRRAYCRLHGLAQDRVDTALFYATTGQTVRLSLPGDDELDALVGELLLIDAHPLRGRSGASSAGTS